MLDIVFSQHDVVTMPTRRFASALRALFGEGRRVSGPRAQYGALPFRSVDGACEILLTTSRETRRWIIPKGWPMKSTSPHRAAAREAFEEAGIKGEISRSAIGSYEYEKRLRDGAVVLCRVEVFPLRVAEQRRRWPEYRQRQTAWFAPEDAAAAVHEPELAALIRGFAPPRTA